MGKQSRRKRERSPGEARAQRYLARLGLPDHPSPLPYRRLMAQDPAWYRELSEADDAAVALARGDDAGPAEVAAARLARYRLVYRDLDTALAEYAARPVMIGAAWLRWWFDHHPPATRIVDLGCGAGVLTCAYGMALPDAEVVGVDAVPEGLACAEELAGRLGVANVSFVAADFADAAGLAGAGAACDQLVAVTAFSDAGLYPSDPPDARQALSSVADVDGPGLAFRSTGVAAVVGERLAPGGTLLAFDRTPDPALAVRFGAALLHAGIEFEPRRAGVEIFVEDGTPMTFTRFVGTRAGGPPPADGEGSAAEGEAALAAWLKRVPSPAYGPEWHDELRFEALKASGAKLVWGAEIDYAPRTATLERREIWELGSAVYGWISTTPRHRQLQSGRTVEELWREYSSLAGQLAAVGFEVRYYDEA